MDGSGKPERKNWYRPEAKKLRASGPRIGSEEVRNLVICRSLATGILPK
ncbi:MAG: hypothetical protein LBQ79_02135 [Deltaproteobacteria bacterium]|nr:hypothetical protein [Deltaproteobacteria bacterium]